MRLGIFGGTFNPIHFGHLRAAEEAREQVRLDKVIFMPSGNPPLKASDLIDAQHRYAMTKLATDSNVNFVVSDIEIRGREKSYTVNTINKLKEIHSGDDLFFILGIDAFLDIPNWWQPEKLISMIDFIIVTRPGFSPKDIFKSPYVKKDSIKKDRFASKSLVMTSGRKIIFVQMTNIDISSTEIRRLLKENKSVKYLLPEIAEQYIYSNSLYKGNLQK